MKDLKIVLYSNLEGTEETFNKLYSKIPEVDIQFYIGAVFDYVKDSKEDISIVTPGNSYGIMSEGFDLAVNSYFNFQLEARVQDKIRDVGRLLLPANSIKIYTWEFPCKIQEVIYTPTMITPQQLDLVQDIPFLCTLSALNTADSKNTILLPLFGIGTGKLHPVYIIHRILQAIKEFVAIKTYLKNKVVLEHNDLIHLHSIRVL
jgi:O-acetyl-ADP-ribose deacetylase (regulator of RNase III)